MIEGTILEKLTQERKGGNMDAVSTLNKVCREVGVCDSGALLSAPGIKHAAELFKKGSNRRIRVACWNDGSVTSCVVEADTNGKVKEEVCCFTAEDGGMELAMAWEAHLTSPEVGYKIKHIEVEGKEAPLVERVH